MALPPILQNLRIPVIGSPLFIISNPDLVIAQCKAGIVGSFPALNARPGPVLHEWLDRITTELAEHNEKHPDRPAAPFAVNQIVHKSNDRLEHDVEACVKYKVPVIITSLGAQPWLNDAIHSYGGITLHDVINVKFAKKALEKGADGLIPVAAGAGGHAGDWSPFALIQELREFFDGPIALSGSIATGGAVAAAQAMGADLGYIGSAFIACHENAAMLHALEIASAFRRQGLARIMMRHAAKWAQDAGAEQLFLLVTRANVAANYLYTSLSFQPVGHYHYRIKSSEA